MLKLAVIDDDALLRKAFRTSLTRHFRKTDTWVLSDYPDSESFWSDFASNRPDIAFIDVMLPGENGLETARRLHAADSRTVIVFVTAYADYAVEGYEFNAAGYLLKPINGEQLGSAMRRALDRLRSRPARQLTVKVGRQLRNIDMAAVTHMESVNRQVRIHANDGPLDCTGRLDEYAARTGADFIRVHKSFAVNRARISTMGAEAVTLDNGKTVPISRSHRNRARDAFFSGLADS